MGELVSDGTCFSCPFCSSKLKISVPDSLAEAEGKKLANTANYQFLPPGGQCSITTTPCMPNLTNVDPGQKIVQIDGKMALGSGCKFMCSQGGMVAVDSPGQKTAKHEVTGLEVLGAVAAVALLFVPGVGEAEIGAAVVEGGEVAGAAAEGGEAAEAAEVAESPKAGQRRKNWLPDGKKETGPPNGSLERRNPQTGDLIQKRYYDSDGKPLKDIDFLHDHGAGDPHVHDWDYPSLEAPNPVRGPGRPVNPDAMLPEDIK